MKKILLTIIVTLILAAIGVCQNQPLQLTIDTDKAVFQVWEPLIFEVNLVNHSSETILDTGWYRVEQVDSDGAPLQNISEFSPAESTMWGNQFSSPSLASGERALAKINVGNSRIPGTYYYKAIAYVPKLFREWGLISSRIITIQIAEKSPKRLTPGENGQVVLYVANDDRGGSPEIDIKVYIDDNVVVDKNYKATMRYNEAFTFNLKQGRHKIRAESRKQQSRLDEEFDVNIVNSWAAIIFQGRGKVYFRIQDEPIGFD